MNPTRFLRSTAGFTWLDCAGYPAGMPLTSSERLPEFATMAAMQANSVNTFSLVKKT